MGCGDKIAVKGMNYTYFMLEPCKHLYHTECLRDFFLQVINDGKPLEC